MPTYYYNPRRSWGKVIFSQPSVILFTGQTLPRADTPQGRHPSWADTPLGRHLLGRHPQGRHPYPWADTPGQTVTAADGTDPTGMLSSLPKFCRKLNENKNEKNGMRLGVWHPIVM